MSIIQYPIKIKILSPVHIGSGNEYFPYEYYIADTNKINIFNLELFIQKYSDIAVNSFLKQEVKPLWQLVSKSILHKQELIRNTDLIEQNVAQVLKNWAEKGNAATIWEFVKNAQSEPYIPGSSIKGAIRTAIAYSMLKNSPQLYDKVKNKAILKQHRERAIIGNKNAIENTVFQDNGDAKNDMMRMWSISDSKPISRDNTLSVVCGKRLSKSRILGFLNYYEVLTSNSPILDVQISFNKYLAESNYFNDELLKMFPKTLDEIFNCLNTFADDIIQWEINYFRNHQINRQLTDLINFYNALQTKRKNNEILLPLGKGTGWLRKTVGLLFKKDSSSIFKDIFYAYRLSKQRPETFPSSREIVDGAKKEVFGWVQITKG